MSTERAKSVLESAGLIVRTADMHVCTSPGWSVSVGGGVNGPCSVPRSRRDGAVEVVRTVQAANAMLLALQRTVRAAMASQVECVGKVVACSAWATTLRKGNAATMAT